MAYRTENLLEVDFETTGKVDLTKVGAHRYSRDKDTVCYLAKFKLDGLKYTWKIGMPLPLAVHQAVISGTHVVAHNREFEACIWNNIMTPRYGWPPIPIDGGICTAAVAAFNGMPRALGAVAAVRCYPTQKDAVGASLMRKMIKGYDEPLTTGFSLKDNNGVVIHKFKKGDNLWRTPWVMDRIDTYCEIDVDTQGQILTDPWMHPLPATEYRIWQADCRVNWRGAFINRDLLNRCIETYELLLRRYTDMLTVKTGGRVPTAGSDKEVIAEAARYGYTLTGNNKDTRAELLGSKTAPAELKELFNIISSIKKTSCSKFYSMRDAICDDGRIRGLMVYYGAMRTGRWASRLIQLQNMTGNADLGDEVYDIIMQLVMNRDIDGLILLFGWKAMDALSWVIRPLIQAEDGKEILDADYSAIEARVLAWGADERWRLEFFSYTPATWPEGRDMYHDQLAKGIIKEGEWPIKDGVRFKPDVYVKSYSEAFKVPYTQVTKKQRKVGKVQELALGYMGGVNALLNFGADKLGMSPQELIDAKEGWRAANPKIKQFWYDMEAACKKAIETPGATFWVRDMAAFFVRGCYLHMQLPSGRLLSYYQPSLRQEYDHVWDKWRTKICYWGRKSDEGGKNEEMKWCQLDTYGGKLVENWTQAVSRDITAHAVSLSDQRGMNTIFHVHDEVVNEEEEGKYTVKEFTNLLCELPAWARTLPVNAEGWKGKYFKKD